MSDSSNILAFSDPANGQAASARNQNGQSMGRKGLETRRKLIDATVQMLEAKGLRELRVADIARAAGTSSATFYVYFADASDAVLAAITELPQSTDELLEFADGDWSQGDPLERARQVVESYTAFWAEHSALFRIRNLAADEGEPRFSQARYKSIARFFEVLTRKAEEAQRAGWLDKQLTARSVAGALMALLERHASVSSIPYASTLPKEEMIASASHIFASMLGPPRR